jgi:hypothetical protein
MCEKTVVECLAAKCMQEPSCTAEGVESFTYLYARCACVSGPPGLSSRWECVLLGGFVVCLVSRYGLGVVTCTAVLRLRLLKTPRYRIMLCLLISRVLWTVVPLVLPHITVIHSNSLLQ